MTKTAGLLRTADNILILPHIKPDGDTIGSCGALCRGLRAMGKTAYVLPEEPLSARYDFLLDPTMEPPAGFQPGFIVAVDCGDIALLGKRGEQYAGKVDLCIDHHLSHHKFAAYTLVDSDAAATGELIFLLLKELGIAFTPAIARAIYVALSTDTGCFRYSNVTPRTHRMAAECIEIGGNYWEDDYRLLEEKTMAAIQAEAEVLKTLEFFREGQVASIVVSLDMRRRCNASEDDIGSFNNITRGIAGVEVGITYKECEEAGWRISMRTKSVIDASAVCARLNGGGHRRAAGASIKKPLSEVKRMVLKAVNKEFDRLDQEGRSH